MSNRTGDGQETLGVFGTLSNMKTCIGLQVQDNSFKNLLVPSDLKFAYRLHSYLQS